MTADLHTHTNASDANLSRQQLLSFAEIRGLKQIAITDHDTMKNSYAYPDDVVKVIEGCELSAYDPEIDNHVHILCYMPKDKEPLEVYFKRIKKERMRAAAVMLERVNRIYPVVTEQSVAKYCVESGVIFKQSIMSVLVEYGYATRLLGKLFQELFNRKDGSCHEEIKYGTPKEVIAAARAARGVVIHAHPTVYKNMPIAARFMSKKEVDGFEVHHPRNSETNKRILSDYCKTGGFIATGGSDYHGANSGSGALPGQYTTDGINLARLLEKADGL